MSNNLKIPTFSRKNFLNTRFLRTQRRFSITLCVAFVLLVVILPLTPAFDSMDVLGLPLSFLFKTIIGPLFILLILKYALKLSERIDLKDPELENE